MSMEEDFDKGSKKVVGSKAAVELASEQYPPRNQPLWHHPLRKSQQTYEATRELQVRRAPGRPPSAFRARISSTIISKHNNPNDKHDYHCHHYHHYYYYYHYFIIIIISGILLYLLVLALLLPLLLITLIRLIWIMIMCYLFLLQPSWKTTLIFDVCDLLIFIVAQPYALVEVSWQGVRLCGIGAGRTYPNINQRIRR